MTSINESAIETLISKIDELYSGLATNSIRKLCNFRSDLIIGEEDLIQNLGGLCDQITQIASKIKKLSTAVKNSYNSYNENVSAIDSYMNSNLASSSSVNISGGSSTYNSNTNDSTSGNKSPKSVGVSGRSKSDTTKSTVSELSKSDSLSVRDLIIEMLAPYGMTKDTFGSVSKTDKGYVVTVNNPNVDGKWKATDIKEYYIKDGKVSGVLTGDDTYINIEDGNLVVDKSNNKIYTTVFSAATGGTGVIGASSSTLTSFANNTNYNTNENKEIFKKFYPSSSDEEFDNFCNKISESEENISNASKEVINTYKDQILDVVEKNEYNYLVIEDNMIKVDYKPVATELYAYESSKLGVNYIDGMGVETVLNESAAIDLAEYIKNTYSIDVNLTSILK